MTAHGSSPSRARDRRRRSGRASGSYSSSSPSGNRCANSACGDAVERRRRPVASAALRRGSRRALVASRIRATRSASGKLGERRVRRSRTGTGSCATGDRGARRSSGSPTCGRRLPPAAFDRGARPRTTGRQLSGSTVALHHEERDRVRSARERRASTRARRPSTSGSPPSIAADARRARAGTRRARRRPSRRRARRARPRRRTCPGTGSAVDVAVAAACGRSRTRAHRPRSTPAGSPCIASMSSPVASSCARSPIT